MSEELREKPVSRVDSDPKGGTVNITEEMIEAAKKELFGRGLVDTFTIRAALEAALTAAPASAAEPVKDADRELAELIQSRLIGVRPGDQDLELEDDDWKRIVSALTRIPSPRFDAPAYWVRINSSGKATFWEVEVPDGAPLYKRPLA